MDSGIDRRPGRRTRWAIALLIVLGTIISVGVSGSIRLREQRLLEAEFSRRAQERILAVERELTTALVVMESLAAFCDSAPAVDRRHFREFTAPILARHPNIQGLGFDPRISAADRTTHEQGTQREGFDGYCITERAPDGTLVPAGDRDEYVVVHFIEPLPGNEAAIGYDIASEPMRREALGRARETGQPAATGRLTLVHETGEQFGVLICTPVRNRRVAANGQGSGEIHGYVAGVFRIGDVVEHALSRFQAIGIDVALTDESAPVDERLMHAHHADGTTNPEMPPSTDLVEASSFDMAGRRWQLTCAPTEALLATGRTWQPAAVLIGGVVVTLLLSGYLLRLTRLNGRLHREIVERVASEFALRESEQRNRTLVEHAPEAIVVLDAETGRIVDFNQHALDLFESRPEELVLLGPADMSPPRQPDGQSSERLFREWIERTLAGETPVFEWIHRDARGRDIPCEVRLVRLSSSQRQLIRGSMTDISDRKRNERRQRLMMSELDHRVKNNLASVVYLADQTCATSESLDVFRKTFTGRIKSLLRTHEALAEARWDGVRLEEVVRLTLEPYTEHGHPRVEIRGRPLRLEARASGPITMSLHELVTNAVKHGALSEPGGRLEVAWEAQKDGRVRLLWRERGGPPADAPAGSGLGLSLIEGFIKHELRGAVEFDFAPEGLTCTMYFPAEDDHDGTVTTRRSGEPARTSASSAAS
ncbi:MAG: PAS domain S-box protein [Planctomycetes bacterium]|nr:PAS domain S-box protein [Planctomycetota bacterium]